VEHFQEAAGTDALTTSHLSNTPQIKPKKLEDHDVDVLIEACGVCGSDVHTINGGWGECPLPICVGHEMIGKAIKVGKSVTLIREGQRVGVGAQVRSCMTCQQCKENNENYCPHMVGSSPTPP
jgi:alcohol dehydrogenase (NADP+)